MGKPGLKWAFLSWLVAASHHKKHRKSSTIVKFSYQTRDGRFYHYLTCVTQMACVIPIMSLFNDTGCVYPVTKLRDCSPMPCNTHTDRPSEMAAVGLEGGDGS